VQSVYLFAKIWDLKAQSWLLYNSIHVMFLWGFFLIWSNLRTFALSPLNISQCCLCLEEYWLKLWNKSEDCLRRIIKQKRMYFNHAESFSSHTSICVPFALYIDQGKSFSLYSFFFYPHLVQSFVLNLRLHAFLP